MSERGHQVPSSPVQPVKPVYLFFSPRLSASPTASKSTPLTMQAWPLCGSGGIIKHSDGSRDRQPEEGDHAMADSRERKSLTTTGGPGRAPNRAMLRAVGFTDDDFDKPVIGVASLFSRHHAVQRPPRPPRREGARGRARRRRRAADVRRADRLRRDLDGPHGHALLARVAAR